MNPSKAQATPKKPGKEKPQEKNLIELTLTFYFSEKKLEYNTAQLHVYIYAW